MDAFVSFLQTPWAIVIALAIAVVIGMVIRLVVSSRRSSNEVTSRPREQVPASGDVAAPAEAEGEADLRQLCGFPRSRLATDDDDLVVGNQAADFVGNRQHGQVGAQFRCR